MSTTVMPDNSVSMATKEEYSTQDFDDCILELQSDPPQYVYFTSNKLVPYDVLIKMGIIEDAKNSVPKNSTAWPESTIPTDLFQSDDGHITWAKFLAKHGYIQPWVLNKMKSTKDARLYLEHCSISNNDIKMVKCVEPWVGHNGGQSIHLRNCNEYNIKGLGRVQHTFKTMCPIGDRQCIKYIYNHSFKLVSALESDVE